MKKLLILLALTALYPSPARADTITILADAWCPYNCEPGSEKPGFGIEIAKYAFEKAGHSIVYKNMPWSRAIDTAREGKAEAIIGAYKEDAPDFVFPQTPIAISGVDFFTLKDNTWKFKDIASLGEISLGAISDYSYGTELDNYIKSSASNPKKVQAISGENALEKNIKKLYAKRIDALIDDKIVVNYKLFSMSEPYLSNIRYSSTFEEKELFIAFSPKNPKSAEYAKILNDGYTELKKSGKLKEILAKYGQ